VRADRFRKRRQIAVAALAVCLVLIVIVVLVILAGPALARRRLVSGVLSNCSNCSFAVDDLSIGLFPTRVALTGVRYKSDPAEFVVLAFDIPHVAGRIPLLSVIRRRWTFTNIDASGAAFDVLEKDPKPETPPKPDTFPQALPPIAVGTITVANGRFTYTHRTHERDAIIRLTEVNGAGGHFTSREELGPSDTSFDVHARLEQSARAHVRARFDPLAGAANDDHVWIDVDRLPLREMNPFFEIDSGVTLGGALERANAALEIRNGRLTGTLDARYRDLSMDYHKTEDRGAVKSFFTETLGKVMMEKTREANPPPPVRIDVRREPGDGIIKFLLSGLKPAARDLMQGK
jgi:hypothetical protein